MKTNILSLRRVRKLDRQELRNLKAGDNGKTKVCCTYNEYNECCEWPINMYCQGLQC